jgi:hypothetical protein
MRISDVSSMSTIRSSAEIVRDGVQAGLPVPVPPEMRMFCRTSTAVRNM